MNTAICYTTTYENNVRRTVTTEYSFIDDNGEENEVINLYPQVKKQLFEGFGGAITDSAGYVYSLLDETLKKQLVQTYFGKNAMKYNQVRIPIDSCDFSLEHYEADSDENDADFMHFSFKRVEKYILPLLDAAEEAYGDRLNIMLSPWSPPVYMKTNGERNHGGKLKPQYRKRWAEYICRYIEEYQKRGYRITALTLQNEPKAVQPWDSCVYTAQEEKEFLKEFMWPSLKAHGLDDIAIYIWDHNKERAFEWAQTIIDKETSPMIAGLAFHWYSGDHFDALRLIQEQYPDKKLLLSEACIEYGKFAADDYLKNAQKYAHDMIGNLNNGMCSFFDWNLLLDEQGGPNHVGNYCDAPFLFDTQNKHLSEGNIAGYLWHFSHFIEPQAIRIGTTCYTDALEVTAFERAGQIIFILLNRTGESHPAVIRMHNTCIRLNIPANAITTGVIE